MKSKLAATRRLFVVTMVSFAVLTVVIVGLVLYATSAIRYHNSVSADKLHSLTQDYPAVAAYLQDQKNAEAHFVTLANLVKSDQQQLLGKALVIALVPTVAVSSLVGYLVARRLLKPVDDTYASQERFLQDAAHEMRNPLAAMTAVIQQARQAKDPNAQARALATLDRQTTNLIKLNEDLLFLEKSRDSRIQPQMKASDLLLDVIDSLQQNAVAAGMQIKSTIDPHITLPMNGDDFVCLARNIIENAIKYSRPKVSRSVTVRFRRQPHGMVELTVTDKGIGIPAVELAHIGERFYRATNVGKVNGTGLGMAIVESLVTKYHGKLSIISKPKAGTTVRITFPAK